MAEQIGDDIDAAFGEDSSTMGAYAPEILHGIGQGHRHGYAVMASAAAREEPCFGLHSYITGSSTRRAFAAALPSVKIGQDAANEPPPGSSIQLERTEVGEPVGAVAALGMSVALERDARQAAAAQAAEEQGLVRKAQTGDRLAFDELVHRYDRDVLRLALNLVHRPEDARDIYQEGFLRAFRNLHRFRFECSFYTWLYRIVTNAALDHLRRRASRPEDQAPAMEAPEGDAQNFFDRQPEERAAADPEKVLLGQELGRHIEDAMMRLSPRERMVFELKHHHGLRLRTIGEMLGTSEETARNSLFRATQKLRASLAGFR